MVVKLRIEALEPCLRHRWGVGLSNRRGGLQRDAKPSLNLVAGSA